MLPELLGQRGERLVDLPGEVVGAGAERIVEVEQLHPFGKRPPALGSQEADPLARCDKLGDHFGAVAGIDDVRLEARLEAEAVGLLGPARGADEPDELLVSRHAQRNVVVSGQRMPGRKHQLLGEEGEGGALVERDVDRVDVEVAVVEELGFGVVFDDLEGGAGVCAAEAPDQLDQVEFAGDVRLQADGRGRRVLDLADRADAAVDCVDRELGVFEKRVSVFVERDAAPGPLEQGHPHLVLEQGDGLAQGRLGDEQLFRRLGDVFGLGHGPEVSEPEYIHAESPSSPVEGAFFHLTTPPFKSPARKRKPPPCACMGAAFLAFVQTGKKNTAAVKSSPAPSMMAVLYPMMSLALSPVKPSSASAQKGWHMLVHELP